MKESNRVAVRTGAVAVLTLASATLVYLFALYVYLKTYAALNPGETTEVDHNASLESAVTIHFRVGYPLLLAAFGWLFWRLSGSWFGRANKRLQPIAREDARSG